MKYEVIIYEIAERDILKLRKSADKSALPKLNNLLNIVREHPCSGSGKPKPLSYGRTDQWSRRINAKHRLVYSVDDEK